MDPPPVDLAGHRVELLELARGRYGVCVDGVRVPLRVRHRTRERALLSGLDDTREVSAEGLEVAIVDPFSNGVGLLASAMRAPPLAVGHALLFERPHVGPGPSSVPTVATTLTIELRDGVVALELVQDYLDDSAF